MSGAPYVLDANVFIEAANRYYAFDLAPRFWQSLVEHAENGRVVSIDRVAEELARGNDDLALWARERFGGAFVRTDGPEVVGNYRDLITWVQSQPQFTDAAKADFAARADGWLVAYARTNGCVVTTHEAPAPEARRKVPIPNLCVAFDVPYVNTFAMLRGLGVQFT